MSSTTMVTGYSSRGSLAVFAPEQTFDRARMRRLTYGRTFVLHCHHYASLFTQLALDAERFDGPALLTQAAAEAFGTPLREYLQSHGIVNTADRIAIAEQYFAFMGLGQVRFECTEGRAAVTMSHSHVDEGWMKKWGQRQKPVNYIGHGFIRAACTAIYSLEDDRTVQVREFQSIVCGASSSKFEAIW